MNFMEIEFSSNIYYTLKNNLLPGTCFDYDQAQISSHLFYFSTSCFPALSFLITLVIDSSWNPCKILMNSEGSP